MRDRCTDYRHQIRVGIDVDLLDLIIADFITATAAWATDSKLSALAIVLLQELPVVFIRPLPFNLLQLGIARQSLAGTICRSPTGIAHQYPAGTARLFP